ncbi:MAG TPA: DUF1580 domain-containing protein [Planctomicrobium sp.]|nr:DUF1580 domain-containing protein [Planctomicrobium sp.]
MVTQTLSQNLTGQIEAVSVIAKRRTGKRPSPATVWRWCRKGVRGGSVKLAAVFHGGCWQTTSEAFDQFLADQTAAALGERDEPEQTDSDAALIAAGLL